MGTPLRDGNLDHVIPDHHHQGTQPLGAGLRVQINLTYPTDPDLSARLCTNMGGPTGSRFVVHQRGERTRRISPAPSSTMEERRSEQVEALLRHVQPQIPLSAPDAAGRTLVVQNSATAKAGRGDLTAGR